MILALLFASAVTVDAHSAERFANLALACVHKEYPNKISHSMNGDADVAPPRELTPAFYGCYDWHSSVHGHWLLSRPIRSGEHSQTAFALGLIIDSTHDEKLRALARDAVRRFYVHDRRCPLSYEPSGEDFLSPCLAEADVVRRVLSPKEFASWLRAFLPNGVTLEPEVVTDPSDPRLAHLDGLN